MRDRADTTWAAASQAAEGTAGLFGEQRWFMPGRGKGN